MCGRWVSVVLSAFAGAAAVVRAFLQRRGAGSGLGSAAQHEPQPQVPSAATFQNRKHVTASQLQPAHHGLQRRHVAQHLVRQQPAQRRTRWDGRCSCCSTKLRTATPYSASKMKSKPLTMPRYVVQPRACARQRRFHLQRRLLPRPGQALHECVSRSLHFCYILHTHFLQCIFVTSCSGTHEHVQREAVGFLGNMAALSRYGTAHPSLGAIM